MTRSFIPIITATGSAQVATDQDAVTGYQKEMGLPDGFIDSNNSTSSALGSSASFTGTYEDTMLYASIVVSMKTDQSGTLIIQQSMDGSTTLVSQSIAVSGSQIISQEARVVCPYYRVIYTNGASAQTSMTLVTLKRAIPGVLTVPQTIGSIGAHGLPAQSSALYNGSQDYRPSSNAKNIVDGDAGTYFAPSGTWKWNGGSFDRERIVSTVKTVTATASGTTTVWTPVSGNKFRLMRVSVEVTNDSATASGADIDITFKDGAATVGPAFSLYVPVTGGTTLGAYHKELDMGNGIVSTTANNVLSVNLSAALTAGKVRIVASGVEGVTP